MTTLDRKNPTIRKNGKQEERMRKLLVLSILFVFFPFAEADELEYSGKSLSMFPILMYDTDIGFGYGAKAKFVNYLSVKESFDLMLFGSTKGERLFDFIFSIPDIEIRQGKVYSLSPDVPQIITHLANKKRRKSPAQGKFQFLFFIREMS